MLAIYIYYLYTYTIVITSRAYYDRPELPYVYTISVTYIFRQIPGDCFKKYIVYSSQQEQARILTYLIKKKTNPLSS